MNIQLKKEQGKTYLTLTPEQKISEFSVRMLTENRIQGILPFERRTFNGETLFFYDITECSSVSHQTETTLLGGKEVRNLLSSLYCLVNELYSYFLEPECLLLDPAYIYEKKNEYRFCYIPTADQGAEKEHISCFAENLLSCINHEDEEAVIAAYCFYQVSKQESYGFLKSLEMALAESPKEEAECEEWEEEILVDMSDNERKQEKKNTLPDWCTVGIFFLLFLVSFGYLIYRFFARNMQSVQVFIMLFFFLFSIPGMAAGFVEIDIKEKK